jgi:hypothetical protein
MHKLINYSVSKKKLSSNISDWRLLSTQQHIYISGDSIIYLQNVTLYLWYSSAL